MIIDARDLKVGRLSTVVAKTALKGESVEIVNSEFAVFTGNKKSILGKYQKQDQRGTPHWGPYLPKMPDRFLKRIIKRMLPMNTARGRDALKRIRCYIGNPENKQAETIKEAHISNSKTLRFMTIKEICQELGGKYE